MHPFFWEIDLESSNYFSRTVVFNKRKHEVAIVDVYVPDLFVALEPWLGVVISFADGQHTIEALFAYMRQQYNGQPPLQLEKTIISVVERLIASEVLRLTAEPVTLPYYLASPWDSLDQQQAKQLMTEDGYLLRKEDIKTAPVT